MFEDNTPTVTARRKKPSRHMRLRLETAKKLRALGERRKSAKATTDESKVVVVNPLTDADEKPAGDGAGEMVKTRAPKVKKAVLASAPLPKAIFRKRQIHKSWLPTHLFHAKRARMTAPSHSLWRFALALTPTAKSYRPTHRAANERGAIAWDMSYMSTISLSGRQSSLANVLKALGADGDALAARGPGWQRWMDGDRVIEMLLHRRESPHSAIASVAVLWRLCPDDKPVATVDEEDKRQRCMLLRVHPSAFLELWEELLRAAKVAKPPVAVEDLRFEVGSIEIVGPGSTEALVSALWPCPPSESFFERNGSSTIDNPNVVGADGGKAFSTLAGLTNPALLPAGALLSMHVQDPRLHHPPRLSRVNDSLEAQAQLLKDIAAWPTRIAKGSDGIFDRKARAAASAALPSAKSINRRRTLAPPGQYPDPLPTDPRIPVLLYTSPSSGTAKRQSKWSLLLPWKCVAPVWYSLMYTPLSSGAQPRFGGLDETRNLALEHGQPWFPADFPSTQSGWEWELRERSRKKEAWERRPKSKRVNWEGLDLGPDAKGEIGLGWACDWRRLVDGRPDDRKNDLPPQIASGKGRPYGDEKAAAQSTLPAPERLIHIPSEQARSTLASANMRIPAGSAAGLIVVRIEQITRGVPQPCARIYRLPSSPILRRRWLKLHPRSHPRSKGSKRSLPQLPKDAPPQVAQQRLAQALLEPPKAGEDGYPSCPGEEDLIGFVTSGNYDLGAGQGMGMGSLLLRKVIDEVRKPAVKGRLDESRLCIVRNAGLTVGRLAKWNIA